MPPSAKVAIVSGRCDSQSNPAGFENVKELEVVTYRFEVAIISDSLQYLTEDDIREP
jgi:hypothetical protein